METDDPSDVHERLESLRIERRLAVSIGLDNDPRYMADLDRQLEIWKAALVTVAVTEIAVTMAQRQGRRQG